MIKAVMAGLTMMVLGTGTALAQDSEAAAKAAVEAARGRHDQDRAAADAAQSVLDRAKAEYNQARDQAERSRKALDKAEAEYEVAKSTAALAKSGYKPGQTFKDCGTCPEMVIIPPGSFKMGSPESEKDRYSNEGPQHRVTIGAPFALGKAEVTQAEWESVMGSNPSYFRGANRPVEQVSWDDVQVFIRKLNERTGKRYRLPSEAEWEYAARAGTTTPWSCGGSESCLSSVAVYSANSGDQTQPVRSKSANAFGLHDMHGNVLEWVQDCLHDNYNGAPIDGGAWTGSNSCNRVFRGGSFAYLPSALRSAYRAWATPVRRVAVLGFRLARTLP